MENDKLVDIQIELDAETRMVWIGFTYEDDDDTHTADSYYLTYDEFSEAIRG